MKKPAFLLLVIVLAAALVMTVYAEPAVRTFTDSAGRSVTVPREIDRVAVTGPLAQIYVFALAPDKLAGIAEAWAPGAEQFLADKYDQLPVLGQLYGGKGEMNLETLLEAGPQVVIDVGEPKGNIAADLDALSGQTGIPFVHIASRTDSMDMTFAILGELLGMEEEAKALADYCRDVYDRTAALAQSVKKVGLLYVTGENGLHVIARDSYHSEVIDLLSNNLAVVDSPSSRGTGNEVDMEQILVWNPETIIFADDSIYASVGGDALWQNVAAIRIGAYYEAPVGPYNWMGFPPGAQRLLGMMWLGKLLYPDAAEYDLYAEVARYFELFYHCGISREQYDALLANSIDR